MDGIKNTNGSTSNSAMNSATERTEPGSPHDSAASDTSVNTVASSLRQARISASAPGIAGPSSPSDAMPAPLPGEKAASLPASPKDHWPEMLKSLKKLSGEGKVNFIFERIGKKCYFTLDRLAGAGLNPATLKHEKTGYTLLHHAIANQNTDMIGECLKLKGLDINAKCINNHTPLSIAALNGDLDSVKKLLTMPNIDVNIGCDKWATPLSKILIDSKLIEENNRETTALQIAIKNHHNEVAQLILDFKDCDLNKKDALEATSLIYAVQSNNEHMVKDLLMKKNIEVNPVEKMSGSSALIMAISNNNANIVDLLLSHKDLDVNFKNRFGMTALHIAKMKNQRNMSEALNKKGAKDLGSIFKPSV